MKHKRGKGPNRKQKYQAPLALSDEDWAALCDGCGLCCALTPTNIACPSLDTTTNRCTVYEKRTDTEMCCQLTPDNIKPLHERGVLPITCGYVRYQLLGVPQRDARLKEMEGKAKLTPFVIAPPAIQDEYGRQKKIWFAKVEGR